MTTRQHMAQQTRRFNEWQERGNRAAGMHRTAADIEFDREFPATGDPRTINRVEDAIIEAQHAAIEERFAVTAEYDKPMDRTGASYRHAYIVYYTGGDNGGYRIFTGKGQTQAAAQAVAAASAREWIEAAE